MCVNVFTGLPLTVELHFSPLLLSVGHLCHCTSSTWSVIYLCYKVFVWHLSMLTSLFWVFFTLELVLCQWTHGWFVDIHHHSSHTPEWQCHKFVLGYLWLQQFLNLTSCLILDDHLVTTITEVIMILHVDYLSSGTAKGHTIYLRL